MVPDEHDSSVADLNQKALRAVAGQKGLYFNSEFGSDEDDFRGVGSPYVKLEKRLSAKRERKGLKAAAKAARA